MNRIIPNLWFPGNAQEAVDFYISVFPNSKITNTAYYPNEGLADFQKDMAGKVITIDFELNGHPFIAINAGHEFTFSEAISLMIECEDQAEIDYFWSKLSAHPDNEQCGWCKDKYGLSWQVVPKNMEELMKKPNSFQIMMSQKKILIREYE